MQKEEIQPDELRQYASELQAAVEVVCKSPSFRTSPKSCQFLVHIVRHTLDGNVDELKERLIGIELLGREASYDTGSDAGVRVRANDVRKRLAAYYSASPSDLQIAVNIPSGSYVPRFYISRPLPLVLPDRELVLAVVPPDSRPTLHQPAALSLPQLALPSLVALFLCVICIRWQIAQEDPFVTFWQTVFQDHHALLYVPSSTSDGQRGLAPGDRIEDTAPLLNLAGQFHAGIALTRTLTTPADTEEILILIGPIPASLKESLPDSSALERISSVEGGRLAMSNTSSGRQIIDHNAGNSMVNSYGRAGLLTIVNGAQHSIHIDGTDDASIDSLIKSICDPSAFPDGLINSFQQGTVTQIVFPMAPRAQAVVFHESLPATETALSEIP
ncbi:MAG: hypothetical protein ABR905_13335 [Terracidiphilus sp.]|jgi:hypothetical protein